MSQPVTIWVWCRKCMDRNTHHWDPDSNNFRCECGERNTSIRAQLAVQEVARELEGDILKEFEDERG